MRSTLPFIQTKPATKMIAKIVAATILIASGLQAQEAGSEFYDTPIDDRFIGSPGAENTVVQYMSLTCKHCKDFKETTFPQIKEQYIDTGEVKYALRFFPLKSQDIPAMAVATCVDENLYYDVIDIIFDHQDNIPTSEQGVIDLLHEFDLPEDEILACSSNSTTVDKILQSRLDAQVLEVSGTPATFVDGVLLSDGYHPNVYVSSDGILMEGTPPPGSGGKLVLKLDNTLDGIIAAIKK